VPGNQPPPSNYKEKAINNTFHVLEGNKRPNLLELLRPGAFVRLENHPNDLPPFQLISCRGGRCLVRQQTWGEYIHWEVEHHRLESA
tara:strand:- start:187 stop:447 length:261 start_codon:yes stop_codon:yes gene_type:complete